MRLKGYLLIDSWDQEVEVVAEDDNAEVHVTGLCDVFNRPVTFESEARHLTGWAEENLIVVWEYDVEVNLRVEEARVEKL